MLNLVAQRFEAGRPLAFYFSKPFWARGRSRALDPEDLVQEALVGLWKASQFYDPDRGVSFATYAGRIIKNRLLNLFVRRARRPPLSLDRLADDFEHQPAAGSSPAAIAAELAETRELLDRWLPHLEPRRRRLVELYYGLTGEPPLDLVRIGEQFGISHQRAHQLLTKSLAALGQLARRHFHATP